MTHKERMNKVDTARRLKKKKVLTNKEHFQLRILEQELDVDARTRATNDTFRLTVLPPDMVVQPYSTYANRAILARHMGVRPEFIEACAAGTMVGTQALEE